MANYKRDIVDINLETGNIHRSFLNHSIGSGDENADRFGFRTFRNGEPENISGTCVGLFIRPDGGTVTITDGVVDGNLAYVTLPEACYAIEGNFTLAIKLVGTDVAGTIRIIDGTVTKTSTDVIIDPGTIIPSVENLIEAIDEAVASLPADYSSLWATLAPVFSTDESYVNGQYVTYNGKVYRFCKNHTGTWSDSDVFEVALGTEMANTNTAFSAFMGAKPLHISRTIASADTTINFTDIKLFAGVQYIVYCAENVPSTPINFYVAGDTTTVLSLAQGYNVFTPAIDGYVRLYNGNAQYSGTLTLDIYEYSSFLTAYQTMITTEAQLTEVTKGSKSCNDFPVNSIVTIGSDEVGLLNGPTPAAQNASLGTYITFSNRGTPTNKAGIVQLFISKHGAVCSRTCWESSQEWTGWRTPLMTNKSYITREAWLEDYPTDKLGSLPQMSVTCIASIDVNPSDAPFANFTGTVMTLGYRSRSYYAEPGDFQIAFSLGDTIYYRRYVFDSDGNYWTGWFIARGEKVYHVGANQEYTSLTGLLYQLKGEGSKKQIILHDGTYDIFAEYKAEIAAGHLEDPPDDVVTSDYLQYSVFVPNNTRITGWGNVTLTMSPDADDVTLGESYMWSPLNMSGNVEMENVTVLGHNCRYCLHNDDHGSSPNAHQYYKNCRFIYTFSDLKNGSRLGYNNTIGFGLPINSTHIYDDCEFVFDGQGNHSAFYGHENNSGKNGTIIVRNCIIRSTDFTNNRVIRLQTLGTTLGLVKAFFENCYINGGLELDLYNESARNNFQIAFVNSNKVPVFRNTSRAPSGVPIADPYTIRWFNPLPTPTEGNPQYEEDSQED